MPKTRNYSDREKRNVMRPLDIHIDINALHLFTGIHHRTLRPWRKRLRRQQNATLSEKSFSLSAKRTMSDKLITKKQRPDSPAPAPNAAIQAPANPIRPTVPPAAATIPSSRPW
ncbi:MAG: hypothetical protein OXG60_18175 [Chloroflexi bacterium]|nr:hypothetical protein [Chloroflexota bacterium]